MGDHGHATSGAGARLSGWELLDVAVVLALGAAAAAYAVALLLSRVSRPWPARRVVAWYLGVACAAGALVGPLGTAARTGFTAHMAAHLLLGMVAPLLLVLGAPVTVLLRGLPTGAGRAVTRVLRSAPARVLSHPATAGALNAGGLWLLYGTDLFAAAHASPLLHGAVHAHVLLAGYLFTAAVAGRDPNPHAASMVVRSVALVAVAGGHAVLARHLYAHPPAGVAAADARAGAQLMYYGGDVVDLVLLVLVAAGWYAAGGRRLRASTPASARVAPSLRPYDDQRAPARRHARRAARA